MISYGFVYFDDDAGGGDFADARLTFGLLLLQMLVFKQRGTSDE